ELKTAIRSGEAWLEGAYTTFDASPDSRLEVVLGVGHTGKNQVHRALQWHTMRDRNWGDQDHMMLLVERPIAPNHRLSAPALFDLKTGAFRIAPTVEFTLSGSTTAALTVAYVNDSRGPLTLPLSNNEVRVRIATRF